MNKLAEKYLSDNFWQVGRFGVVGGAAAITHFSVVILLVTHFAIPPLLANILAFFTAFIVSYLGHKHWTFSASGVSSNVSGEMSGGVFGRFFIVAFLSLLLNESLFYLLLNIFRLYYILALMIVLILVPPLTFICSKFWVFNRA